MLAHDRSTGYCLSVIRRYKTDESGKTHAVASIYQEKEHPIRNQDIDKDALWAIKKIQSAGGEAYIVGGAIRDMMLGRKPKDFDIATSLSPRQVQRLFWNARIIGKRFRIVHLFFGQKIIEVTTFRSDEENFEDGKNNMFGTIEQDAHRRDFSINSLYYNPANCQLLDFTDAMPDFRKRIIRSLIPLSYSFSEDPVRMIRALKYQATTGFSLEKGVRKAIKKNAERIQGVSISRLTEEVSKIISSGASYQILRNLSQYGLLQYILPCFSLYIEYREVEDALIEADRKVSAGIAASAPLDKDEILAIMLRPMICFPESQSENPEDLFREGFRQAKILVSPMTPPNYELEKAVDLILQDMGIKRARKSAEARAPRKKPNTMGRKRAAEEVLSSVSSERRQQKRKKIKAAQAKKDGARTLAEARDD